MSDSRLLIIDDDVEVGAFVASVAESCGYSVESVSRAEDFFRRFEAWQPSHIMLDLRMPDIDGIEMLRFLVDRRCRARLVVFSGVDQKIIESARHLGIGSGLDVAAALRKPVRAGHLRTVLEGLKGTSIVIDEAAIVAAIANRELRLAYQPKVLLREPPSASGRLRTAGFEALLRWQHPRRGVVTPGEFLPLAETLALMDDLTDLVIEEGVSQLRQWQAKGLATTLALNLSAVNLQSADFIDRLLRRCRTAEIAPELLTFELTETAAMTDPIQAMNILTRLRLKGFRLSIDDFGTGYSSLVQLQRLPFSELKIDRALVVDCATSSQSRIIVKTAIDLAQNLGLVACAEGIESPEAVALLQELGCDLGQGYHFAQPMAPDQAEAWLRQE